MFFDPIAQDNREDHVPAVATGASASPVPVSPVAASTVAPASQVAADVAGLVGDDPGAPAGGDAAGASASPVASSIHPVGERGHGRVEGAAGGSGGGLAARLEVLVGQFDVLADEVLADCGSGREAAVLVPLIARLERRASALGVVVGGRAVASKRREEGGDRVAAEWLSQQTSGSRRDVEGAFSLLEGFASHGSVRGAFEAGDLTRNQAELVLAAAVADPGCEDEMLSLAGRAPVEDLARESRKRVRAARRETLEERERRHHRNRRLWMVTDDDGAFVGGFSIDPMTGAVLKGGIGLWTEAMFRRDRRLGVRNKNSARQMDALVAMSQIATGATPAGLGFELCDLPAALRPREGDWIGDPPPTTDPHAGGPVPGTADTDGGSRALAGGSTSTRRDDAGSELDGTAGGSPGRASGSASTRRDEAGSELDGTEDGSPGRAAGSTPTRRRDAGSRVIGPDSNDAGDAFDSRSGSEDRSNRLAGCGDADLGSGGGPRGGDDGPSSTGDDPAQRKGDSALPPSIGGEPHTPSSDDRLFAAGGGEVPSGGGDPPASGGGAVPDGGPGTRPRVRYRARGPASPVINIHVDVGPLRRGHLLPDEMCEIEGVGPVSVTAVRDLVGDALLKLILKEGRDVYNTTHARRSMSAHQKTAVLAMYQECCVAGCGSRVGLQDDHQVPWAKTRHTWAPGMHPICPHHHDRKTHHGWDFVPEPPDPTTGHLRLVPPEDPDHPDNTGAPRPMPPDTPAKAPSGP